MAKAIAYAVKTKNKLNQYIVTINESKSTVDIALAKRYDVISQMCDVIKKYTSYEQNIMSQLIYIRQGGSLQETNAVIDNQSQVLKQIHAVAEAYPELASNGLYSQLMGQIASQNEYLAATKRTLNSNISMLNQRIVTFPASVVAGMSGIGQMEFLREENLEMKRNFNIGSML